MSTINSKVLELVRKVSETIPVHLNLADSTQHTADRTEIRRTAYVVSVSDTQSVRRRHAAFVFIVSSTGGER
jgi:hypothetical protein